MVVNSYEVFTGALNDYARNFKQWYMQPELFKDDNPELFAALTGWADRLTLPDPQHLPIEA
jgi:hypothetical protein